MWFHRDVDNEPFSVNSGMGNSVELSPMIKNYPTADFHQSPVSGSQLANSYRLSVKSNNKPVPSLATSFTYQTLPYHHGRSQHVSSAVVSGQKSEFEQSIKSYVSGGGFGGNVSSAHGNTAGGASGNISGAYNIATTALPATAYIVPFAASSVTGGVTTEESTVGGRAKRGALDVEDEDLRPDYDREDPVETPIGELPAVLILVLAIGYAIVKRKKTGGRKYEGQMNNVRGI